MATIPARLEGMLVISPNMGEKSIGSWTLTMSEFSVSIGSGDES
jgi:hypothetical protein